MRPLALPILMILVSSVALAGDASVEGGRFTLFVAGREAGAETVTARHNGVSLVLASRAKITRTDHERDLELSVTLDLDGRRIRTFSAHGVQAGRERVVTLAAKDGRLVGEIREGEGARAVVLAAKPGSVFLAEPFTAPYLLLLKRYDLGRGGDQTFPAVFPIEGRTGTVTLLLEEEQALEIDGRAVLARRILVRPDRGPVANLWIDAEGRLLVCSRAVEGLSAVRGRALRIGLKPGEDPPDPDGVSSIRIRFAAEGVTLAGTVTRPRGVAKRLPAVVLLSGSGPQDRNGNAPGAELQWSLLHTISVALARVRVASLRFDERGVGRSSGRFYDAGVAELLSDARSAIAYLRSREDVDPSRVGIVGHSEGALLAALLAGTGGQASSVVLLGAPADPLDRILLAQVERSLARRETEPLEAQRILGEMRAFFEHVRLASGDIVSWRGRTREARWLRQHMALDPLNLYGLVRCPALVLHGERDAQVPADQAGAVRDALGDRATGFGVLGTLDHFLMPTRGGLSEYAEANRRIAPEALDRIAAWLSKTL